MKKISATLLPVSAMSELDVNNFISWVWEMKPLNMFDPDIIGYPRTVMCKAESEDEPLLYMPLQSVLMYDAIAPKPGLDPRKEALSLARISEQVEKAAKDSGHREVYFFCRDDRVADMCANHGFEEIKNVRVLRRKIDASSVKQAPDEPGSFMHKTCEDHQS